MAVTRYDVYGEAEDGYRVEYEDFLELSQLASKLLKMSTYHLLSPEEKKRFNELTEGCNDDS